jgi:hypothetical protein
MFMTTGRYIPVKNGIGLIELGSDCVACTDLAENGCQRCAIVNRGSVRAVICWTG